MYNIYIVYVPHAFKCAYVQALLHVARAVIHKIFALPYTAAWLHLYVTMVTQHPTVFVKKLWTDDPVAYDTIFMDR